MMNGRDDGEMKNYHHPVCIFDTFKRVKATTKVGLEMFLRCIALWSRLLKTLVTWRAGVRSNLATEKLLSPSLNNTKR